MLEFYWAYSDFQDLIDLTNDMLQFVVQRAGSDGRIEYQGEILDFSKPARQLSMVDAVCEYTELAPADTRDPVKLRAYLQAHNISIEESWGTGRLLTEVFDAQVEDRLQQPTFITHYPTEVSPLSRRNDDDPDVTDRFELFIAGKEIANGFSELNDPVDQAERFRRQAVDRESGDAEAMHYDQDYITALEYGLPPTAGEGVGIDRLVMLLADVPSIRDVLLFPLMRPRDG
jgi:lysyl-tRNA synthetase class 2